MTRYLLTPGQERCLMHMLREHRAGHQGIRGSRSYGIGMAPTRTAVALVELGLATVAHWDSRWCLVFALSDEGVDEAVRLKAEADARWRALLGAEEADSR